MKQLLRYLIGVLSFIVISAGNAPVIGQTTVFNPSDPVVNYNRNSPPTKPASGQVGKWVRTPRVSFNTSSFKAYIYRDIPFRLKYPKNYDPTKTYPILVFFHGIGEFGTIYDNEYQLYLGGQKHASAVDAGTFNGFLLYPQSQSEFWSTGSLGVINTLIESIMVPQLNVDPFRIFINGLSAGGQTTWSYLINYPKTVAAITPISAAYQSFANEVQKYKYTPIYHFQGALDEAPTPITSRKLGNTILNAGGNYKYKEYANQGHGCWNVAWNEADYFAFYNRAHKANPWPAFGKTEFCEGEIINTSIGVTAGFEGYEWRRNGLTIAGANGNELSVTEMGTYDCRILKGTRWSVWSPTPIVIKSKTPAIQPTIRVTGLASRHLPAPDGSTAAPLEVSSGYETYNWQKESSTTILSTTRYFTAMKPGNYTVQVTDKFSCQKSTFKIDAEDYVSMSGVQQEVTSDVGGGLKVGLIDLNDYMDYTVNVALSGTYTFTARLAANTTGAQFRVLDAAGSVLATINVPTTGATESWTEVNAIINLAAGTQTIRLQSIAAPRWYINYFQFTGANTGDFAKVFTIVDANGINAPMPVSNLVANSISKSSVQLTWDQVTTPEHNETGFEVYQASSAGGVYKLVIITAANATGATINGLSAGSEFIYKVRAINNTSASSVSNPTSVITQADITPPTAPTNLRVGTLGKSSIQLYWDKATDDVGVVKYDVYVNGQKGSVTSALNIYVYHLIPNTTYTFTVKARDLGNNSSSPSNAVTALTKTGTNIADPTMVPADPYNHSVYLNLNLDDPAAAPWNNMNVLPSADDVTDNLKTYAGNYSGIRMTIVENFSGYNAGGMNTGNNSGVYPDNVIRSAYYNEPGNAAKLRIDGLSLGHKYSFVFFGSRNGGGDRTSTYTINGQNVYLNAALNTSNTIQIDNVVPDINGSVIIEIALKPGASYSYLNSLVIKGYKAESSGGNQAPTVNAGADKTIALPTNSVTMKGSASDGDGTVAGYSWSRTSGPSQFSISNSSDVEPVISNLVEGTYIFRLTATDNAGAIAFDDVQVIVNAAPPPPGSNFIKVNLFGGTNPYNNAEWNNWNVSSSRNSGTLKYSDASTSSVSAAISGHTLSDNGVSFGSGMAPAEVLRYTSYSTAARTLTFSGLSSGKAYNLELYAGRANTGNSTIFTAGGTSVTILTDNNKTNKASFTNLTADGAGKLVVNIVDANTYNYLNGFILTELGDQPGAPTASAGADEQITLPASSLTLNGSASDADGSITSFSWSKISGPVANINNPGSASTTVSNLVEGTYIFRLTVTDNDGFIATNDVQVVVNAAPPPAGTRYVQVNLYGGSNPYNNAAWNNWNVSGSLNSGTLKYSDASTSGVSAALSKSSGVNDNGSAYGSGMAPAEVLRYASNATTTRTLTLNGLSANATYSLELYGSRDNYNGNYTVFTINGAAQSISTYRNFTNKAVFTSLSPNAQGQIVVTIANSQTYNYLNGFTLTETVGEQSLITGVSGGTAEVSLQQAAGSGTLSVAAFPNPTRHSFTLQIRGTNNTALKLRVYDVSGRVVEQRQNVPANTTISIGVAYGAGTYYAEITQNSEKKIMKLVKTNR